MRVRLMLWHNRAGEHRSVLVGEGRKRLNVVCLDTARLRVRHLKRDEVAYMRPLPDLGRALTHYRNAENAYGATREAQRLIASAEYEAGRGELAL